MKNSEQPINARTAFNQNGDITAFESEFLGLTKREYFAGLAMQGLLANNREEVMTQNEEELAKLAINHADEILKQLDL